MNGFEKWAKETYGDNVIDNTPRYQSLPYLTDLKMAYKAGAAAGYANGVAVMKERCAEVAEADDTCECSCSSDYECNHCAIKKNIAAAIRGMEI